VAVVKGLGVVCDVIFLGDGARASNNIGSSEGIDMEGRDGSCDSKDTSSKQAGPLATLATSAVAGRQSTETPTRLLASHPWSAAWRR
jgi:hypothetical protein